MNNYLKSPTLLLICLLLQITTLILPINTPWSSAGKLSNQSLVKKFKINGIGLRASEKEIIEVFGKPIKLKRTIASGIGCGSKGTRTTSIFYQETEFHFLNGYLAIITTKDSKYKTESGVGVGDNLSKVKFKYSKYGQITKIPAAWGSGSEIRPFIFYAKNGVIQRIALREADDLC